MLTVYKASAGSGKTYTLAYEYIKLVLGYKDKTTGKYRLKRNPQDAHHAILAITFTNKATDEMKRRIIKELAILAEVPAVGDEKSPYLNDLIKLFECKPEELKSTAYEALTQLLFDFTFFNVSTIDSFFQNVLRTFALEVELDGNYEVELNDNYAISMGLNEVFNAISHRDDKEAEMMADWIKRFMMQKINDGSDFNILNRKSMMFGNLLTFLGKLCDEQFKKRSDELVEYLSDHSRIIKFEEGLVAQISKLRNSIKSTAQEVLKAVEDAAVDVAGITSNVCKPLMRWSQGVMKEPNATCMKVADGESSAFTKGYLKKNQVPESVEAMIGNAIGKIAAIFKQLSFLQLLRSNIYGLGLIGDTMRFVKAFRENNNLILLSDTNDLLRRVISEDDAPFIYERLGVRLQHFLIDEFQDTSRLQWENLSPLVSESLANDNDNLIIGDEKQCIYRFRNSDPSLLRTQVSDEFGRHVYERGIHIKDNTNWRSSAEVVKFNNTIFSAMAVKFGLEDVYANVTQQVSAKHVDHHGYVKCQRIEEGESKEDKLNKACEIMVADIKRQLDSGYQPRDIAILVRVGEDGERVIDYLLKKMAEPDATLPQFNIISDDTLQIGASPMVKLIVSVLRLINTDFDPVDSRSVSKRRYNQIVNRYEYHLNKGMEPHEALNAALNVKMPEIDRLVDEVADMKYTSLPSLVERIICRYIPEDLRHRDNAFITAFQDEVLDFCSNGSCDINSFLKWWDNPKVKHNVTSSNDIEAIRVMTIHKSKGLEFKCVHIPFANWPLAKDSDFGWFEKPHLEGFDEDIVPPLFALKNNKELKGTQYENQYEKAHKAELVDTINVTYVAFTRAIDELCVTCVVPDKKAENCIGTAIYDAFAMADSQFCADMGARHKDAKGELFMPLDAIDENQTLVLGKPTIATKEDVKKEVPQSEMVDIEEASPYVTAYRDDMWNLTRVDDFVPIDEARERGIFLHNVLGSVRRINDLRLAVDRWGYRARLSKEEKDEAYSYLYNAISNENVSKWFEGFDKVVAERPITLQHKEAVYRPDRVVWTAEGTVDVIDYKFGKEHKSQYEKQVKNYMNLLSEMGNNNVRGFLWYVDENKIVEVK